MEQVSLKDKSNHHDIKKEKVSEDALSFLNLNKVDVKQFNENELDEDKLSHQLLATSTVDQASIFIKNTD